MFKRAFESKIPALAPGIAGVLATSGIRKLELVSSQERLTTATIIHLARLPTPYETGYDSVEFICLSRFILFHLFN